MKQTSPLLGSRQAVAGRTGGVRREAILCVLGDEKVSVATNGDGMLMCAGEKCYCCLLRKA